MEYVKQTGDFIEKQIEYPMSNPYIMAFVKVTLALYAVQIAPRPPQYLSDFFQNTFAKIALITIIVYLSNKDLQLALLLSIIYVSGMNLLSGRGIFESFSDYSSTPSYIRAPAVSMNIKGVCKISSTDEIADPDPI
jgi:hypothetical protein